MAITTADLRWFKSERMTDNTDGGGQMTASEILSVASNQIFDDLTDVDRAAGDVSIRKVYAAVTSADTAKYLDSGVVVFREPADANVSVLAFSTESAYDERSAIKSRLEQTISRGARWNGWLWGQHLVGQRAVVLWQRPEAELPPVGVRLELVAKSGTTEQYSQFLWVTRVLSELRTQYDEKGTYSIRSVTLEIAEPLAGVYTGSEPSRYDPTVSTATALVYATRYNAEAVPLHGIRPLVEAAGVGDFTVKVDTLYSPVIPTALSETALPDVTPGGDSAALVAGRSSGTVGFTTTVDAVKPDGSLYLGSPCTPGTLTLTVSGSTFTDDNGAVMLSGAQVGSIDYGAGVLTFASACPAYGTATKTIAFRPAVAPLRVADTASQRVTAENRGFVWVLTLSPIPAPGTLRIAYRVNNAWYVLTDAGGGLLTGADSSYGTARLDFSTGTVTLSLSAALPDVDSDILYVWGTPVGYTARGGAAVDAPVVRGQTAHGAVAPGTVTVTWSTYSLTDNGTGTLTGTGGTGGIRYATGEWWVRPTTLPAVGTEFQIAYQWGDPVEEVFPHPLREPNSHLALTLNDSPQAGTVEVEWNLVVLDYRAWYSSHGQWAVPPPRAFDPIKIIRDNGAGVLTISGGTNGTVNYGTGLVDFLPDVTTSIPKPLYSPHLLGTSSMPINGGVWVENTYRTLFDGWEWIPAGAQYPSDETGWVKVRYRVAGGDQAATETLTLAQLELDLTKGYAETITRGSVRFRLGVDIFVDTAGVLYRNPGPDTGAGTLAGTLDPSTGTCRISNWTAGGTNAVTLEALVTEIGGQPVDEVTFRTPVSPIKSGTLQLRYTTLEGAAKTKTVGGSGILEDADCTITMDYPLGVCRARFGTWRTTASLTPEEMAEPWYDPGSVINIGGTDLIWKPTMVAADSIVYNAVAATFLPPDSDLLGLDAARMPPDGRALIYTVGRLVLIHHTDTLAVPTLSPTQEIDCGRVRLYRALIEAANGARLPLDTFTVNRELGTVTMAAALDLTGYPAPYTIYHTVADLARIVSTDISGALQLQRPLSHVFPADESRVSGVLFAGTLQARYSNLFAQASWDGVWSDTLRGSAPLAKYNDTLYPIGVSNAGAYPDRFLVKFTSSTQFQVIGENLGLIGAGDVNTDCTPINSLTGQAYLSIDYRGWGAGWATGNCVRFNVVGACYPVDLVRAVQPSSATGASDSVELLLVGNVDA